MSDHRRTLSAVQRTLVNLVTAMTLVHQRKLGTASNVPNLLPGQRVQDFGRLSSNRSLYSQA